MVKNNREKIFDCIIIKRINNRKQNGIIIKSYNYEDGLFFDNKKQRKCLRFMKQYITDIFNEIRQYDEDVTEFRNKYKKVK